MMRTLTAAISCLLVVLSVGLGVCDEPAKKSDISFVVPILCSRLILVGPCRDECKGLCLAGSYEAGLDVVLLGKAGISSTKTASTCTYRYPSRPAETLTQLEDTEKYAKSSDRLLLEHANVALLGVDPAEVRQVPLNPDTSPLPDKMEQEARRLAGFSPGARNPNELAQERGYGPIFESSPTIILRAGNATLLSFDRKDISPGPGEHGLLVLFINDKGYKLPGDTAIYPFFFTVKDKSYLAYNIPWVTLHTLVYDLSGAPNRVFPN